MILTYNGRDKNGDPTYGGRRKLSEKALSQQGIQAARSFDRQALHAAVLGFDHPVTGEAMRFEAPTPADMADLIAALARPKT